MWSWENPVYNRHVAVMGEAGLQGNYADALERHNKAYSDWQRSQQIVGDPTDPPGGGGPPFPGSTPGIVHGTAVGSGPVLPPQMTGDPTSPGAGPPFPSFDGPVSSVAPNNPPTGPTTVQDMPLPGVAGGSPSLPSWIPFQPKGADLERLLGQMGQYRQRNQAAYANQMGGGWTGGVYPADMMQTFQEGGQFNANPTSGIRPTNPFAQNQQASFGAPGQANGSSYGGLGGLGGTGGGSGPFNISNPYAPR